MLFDVLLLLCLGLPAFVIAQGSLWPAALPLAVRSPYLNSYINSVAGTTLPNQWPTFWNENRILGWSGWIRVDGTTYELWGQSGTTTNLTNVEITPTRTKLSITAGTMNVNVTWLSPIEPSNIALQSLPFSYIYLEASSNDGAAHTIQFYSDISCEWISGDSASLARWNTTNSDSTTYHMCTRQSPQTATEIGDLVEDAFVYYGTLNSDDASFQTGNDTVVRGDFRTNGALFNSVDTKFRAINQNFVVLGHAVDLGSISSTSSPVVFALGLVRDPAIIMTTPSGNQTRSSYFFSEYGTVGDAIDFFLGDFDNAQQRATDLDDKLLSDAKAVSTDYADLVSLAARQALAVDITVSHGSDGTFNTSDVMTFMRDTGNSRRTNPVEVIYAAFPAFLYFNATWAGSLLAPLLKYQASSLYSRSYAAPDLGASYPYAAGNSNPNIFGALEDSADMLIMGWAHARFSGDGSMLREYYNLYKNFAGYMISNNVVKPSGYSDADGVDNANMTNLAIKGILGIKAMSEISSALGEHDDSSTYSEQASSFYDQWKSLADSQGHLVSTYNELSSWALIYNLFADKLLGTKLVDNSIYTQQDSFYASQADVAGSHGLLYDSTVPDEVKSHWTMFTAAAASDSSVRDTLISLVHIQAASNASAGVFPTTYSADNGTAISGRASPAQGAMFSVLALNLHAQSVSASLGGKSKKE
ncbi:DUF1793-domain-containing protein [Hymenopellis radicata]|nr:DUF1793-domain-containing protein [Hymenopellis radicata]